VEASSPPTEKRYIVDVTDFCDGLHPAASLILDIKDLKPTSIFEG